MSKNNAEDNITSDSEKSTDTGSDSQTNTDDSSTSSNGRKQPKFFIANPVEFFNKKEICYYKNIDKFFRGCHAKHPEILTCMINIIEGKSDISLRVLDWFITKYSKKKIPVGIKNGEVFDVKISYKAQLKSYKKRNFDPFRRRKKFFYPCTEEGYILENGENKHVFTTLGQLNFFKWAFSNNIIAYVDTNLDQIISEMNNFNKDEKKKKQQIKEESKAVKSNKIITQKAGDKKVKPIIQKPKEVVLTLSFD
jgi:hypothetical protein